MGRSATKQRLRRMGVRGLIVLGLSGLLQGPVAAARPDAPRYRAAARVAVLYDAPSLKARKRYIAPRGMPLEVLTMVGAWVKVRDMAGAVLWIERDELVDRHSVVTATTVTVRQQPQDAAPVVFQAGRGVLLEMADAAASSTQAWLRVRHRDAGVGWVRGTEVWGW
jgi:SH3-like domain-containing protein